MTAASKPRARMLQQTMHVVSSLVIALSAAVAQTSPLANEIRTLHHQTWGTEEGLPQGSVQTLLQTRDGYLWAGTEGGGVARFDGVTLRTFGSGDVSSFAGTADGTLWAGTVDGLMALRDGRLSSPSASQGLPPSAIVTSLAAQPGGMLWVLSSDGLFSARTANLPLANVRFRKVPVDTSSAIALQATCAGRTYLVARNGLFLVHEQSLEQLSLPPALAAGILGVAEGPTGELWTRTAASVAVRDRSGVKSWSVAGANRPGSAGGGLPGSRVLSLSVDREGTAWVGTNHGLAALRADEPSAQIVPFIGPEAVLATMQDVEGNEWVGTESTGSHVLRHLKFSEEPAFSGLAVTSAVSASDGALWVGTRADGVRRLMRQEATSKPAAMLSISSTLTSPVVLGLAAGAQGSVWAGTPDGLNHVSATGKVQRLTTADGLPDDFIRSVFIDVDGSVWAGTRHGLVHLGGDTARSKMETFTRGNGLESDMIGPMLRGRGATAGLWVGTSSGLSHMELDGKWHSVPLTQEMSGNTVVTALALDPDNALWVGLRAGLLGRWQPGRFQFVRAFAGGEITGLVADANGDLWVRTPNAVVRLSRAALERCTGALAPCDPGRQPLGRAEGLPSEEQTTGTSQGLRLTAGGVLLVPTRRGLALAETGRLPDNPVPPPVVLQQVLLDDAPLTAGEDKQFVLPFRHNRLTFDYAAISFTAPSLVRYRVMLEGFDRTWIDAGARRSATYTGLPPGRYTFHVMAANNDGLWSAPTTVAAVRIVPPFYRRLWFAALVLLGLLGIAVLVYRLRLRQVASRFGAVLGERNRVAREIHDTLAQDFVGVSLQLDMVARLLDKGKADDARAQVAHTRRLVVEGLAEARRSIWQLRANTSQSSLPTRLEQIVVGARTGTTKLRLSMGGAYRALPAGVESEVLRIAQEAVANVQRHAQATEAEIALHYGESLLTLKVVDNGRGFDAASAAPVGHYGLQGMRERARLLNAKLEVIAAEGTGTQLTLALAIPLPERHGAERQEVR